MKIQVFVVLFIMLAVRVLSDDTATSPEDATDKPVEEGTCDAGTNGDGKCGDAKKDAEETAVPKKEPSNKFKSKIKLGKGKIELKVDMPHFCQFDTFFKSEEEIDELNWRLNGSKEAERGSKDEDSCCQTHTIYQMQEGQLWDINGEPWYIPSIVVDGVKKYQHVHIGKCVEAPSMGACGQEWKQVYLFGQKYGRPTRYGFQIFPREAYCSCRRDVIKE